jgi:hypothetical protein
MEALPRPPSPSRLPLPHATEMTYSPVPWKALRSAGKDTPVLIQRYSLDGTTLLGTYPTAKAAVDALVPDVPPRVVQMLALGVLKCCRKESAHLLGSAWRCPHVPLPADRPARKVATPPPNTLVDLPITAEVQWRPLSLTDESDVVRTLSVSEHGHVTENDVPVPVSTRKGQLAVRPAPHTRHRVSYLVCLAFHGPPRKGTFVVHADGNVHNVHACNLSWP